MLVLACVGASVAPGKFKQNSPPPDPEESALSCWGSLSTLTDLCGILDLLAALPGRLPPLLRPSEFLSQTRESLAIDFYQSVRYYPALSILAAVVPMFLSFTFKCFRKILKLKSAYICLFCLQSLISIYICFNRIRQNSHNFFYTFF